MAVTAEQLVVRLKDSILDSPHLAVMILGRNMDIVWHNRRFGQEFAGQEPIVGKKCFRVTGSDAPHPGCPLRASSEGGRHAKGYFDFGDRNFFFITVPLGDGFAAKIHTYLPKEAAGQVEEL